MCWSLLFFLMHDVAVGSQLCCILENCTRAENFTTCLTVAGTIRQQLTTSVTNMLQV